MNIEVLCIHEDYADVTTFTNFYVNLTEWFASPGGTKILKPIEEMTKNELNVFLKRFYTSVSKRDGTLSVYKSTSMKSI